MVWSYLYNSTRIPIPDQFQVDVLLKICPTNLANLLLLSGLNFNSLLNWNCTMIQKLNGNGRINIALQINMHSQWNCEMLKWMIFHDMQVIHQLNYELKTKFELCSMKYIKESQVDTIGVKLKWKRKGKYFTQVDRLDGVHALLDNRRRANPALFFPFISDPMKWDRHVLVVYTDKFPTVFYTTHGIKGVQFNK